MGENLGQTLGGLCGESNNRSSVEKRVRENFLQLQLGEFEGLLVYQIGLGENANASPGAEKLQNFQMLPALGHDTVIGGDHENGQIYTAQPANGIFQVVGMPGHIHQCDLPSAWKTQRRNTGLDGESALFFHLHSVGVDTA